MSSCFMDIHNLIMIMVRKFGTYHQLEFEIIWLSNVVGFVEISSIILKFNRFDLNGKSCFNFHIYCRDKKCFSVIYMYWHTKEMEFQ